jgi:hypothetical protein
MRRLSRRSGYGRCRRAANRQLLRPAQAPDAGLPRRAVCRLALNSRAFGYWRTPKDVADAPVWKRLLTAYARGGVRAHVKALRTISC